MQQNVQERIARKVIDMFERLVAAPPPPSGPDALALLIGDPLDGQPRPNTALRADRCDFLPTSAGIDRLPDRDDHARTTLSSPDLLFQHRHDGLEDYGAVRRDDIPEYARLVARQLRSGKVTLAGSAVAGGTVFAVGKPSGAQREV